MIKDMYRMYHKAINIKKRVYNYSNNLIKVKK